MMKIDDEGGRGVRKCPSLADIICEQLLMIMMILLEKIGSTF